jgi:hypothetical protein
VDDAERARRTAVRDDAVLRMALTVLLARAGGSLSFTRADYVDLTEQYGGSIHFEGLGPTDADSPDEIRVMLVRKPPGNATLPS